MGVVGGGELTFDNHDPVAASIARDNIGGDAADGGVAMDQFEVHAQGGAQNLEVIGQPVGQRTFLAAGQRARVNFGKGTEFQLHSFVLLCPSGSSVNH